MKDIIGNLGFDEKESEVYLALIKLEQGSVNDLMKKTTIERRTIYDVLERLQQKGAVSTYLENKKTIFQPIDPNTIAQNLIEKVEDFKKIIPQLTPDKKSETKVEVLKGKNGLITVFNEIINAKATHYSYGDLSPFLGQYKDIADRWLNRLEVLKLKEYVLYSSDIEVKQIKTGQYRKLSNEHIFPTPILIYNNTIIQFIYSEPIVMIKITNKEVAKTHKQHFNHFWKLAKNI